MKQKGAKIYSALINFLRICIIVLLVVKVVMNDFQFIHYLLTTFLFTFYDKILQKYLHFRFGSFVSSLLLIFIFLSQVLGRTFEFYTTVFFWDILLHTIAGVLFYFMGKELILHFNQQPLKEVVLILACVSFALAIGVIWEIAEFTYDWLFIKNTQEARGLIGMEAIIDTMSDLIVLTVGAFSSIIFDYFQYHKKRKMMS